MAAGNNALWKSVCKVVARPDLETDARYTSTTLRAQHQVELRDTLEAIFASEDAEHWIARFREAGVPCAPINTYSQVRKDTQVEHMEWIQPLELPNGVQTRTFASPIKFSGKTPDIRMRPPGLGEHNAELLKKSEVEA